MEQNNAIDLPQLAYPIEIQFIVYALLSQCFAHISSMYINHNESSNCLSFKLRQLSSNLTNNQARIECQDPAPLASIITDSKRIACTTIEAE